MVVALLPQPEVEPLLSGRMTAQAVLVGDVEPGPFGRYAVADTEEGRIILRVIEDPGLTAGDHVVVDGIADGRAGEIRGEWYRSSVDVIEIDRVQGTESIQLALGNTVRRHVMHRLQPFDEGRALLAGFLIGDTSRVEPADLEAMRTAGLSHFVAVSGSNVALVLLIVAVVAGPLALGPKRRAVIGLLVIPIYAAATRFEPSVMRASVMAGLALVGRLFGVILEAWQLMALSVSALVVMDPSLTRSVGFQLSVAATAGVLVGGRWPTKGGPVRRALAVTIGAQAAVAPLLLLSFGSVPLLSPLVNLLAAPLVAFATVAGAVGVGGFSPLTEVGAAASTLVLELARGASVWPQVDALQLSSIALAAIVALRFPTLRSATVVIGAVVVVLSVLGSFKDLPDAGVVVLDVGQGDAILIAGGGHLVLVDGGPDPVELLHDLRRYGVDRLDIVVVTHGDADHAAGLAGVVGRYDIGEVWDASEPHETASSSLLSELLSASGVPVHVPRVGETRSFGLVADGGRGSGSPLQVWQRSVDCPPREWPRAHDASHG